ncbi:NusB antitermination factor [Candidatus Omnitrophus magneticus]|uniref:Transcription antitermination protein NusB n=1 Tax=Candidatus Omnitrophus magneticus TaxID=1609969 RepID=A0A0F0CP96_9BACT|nr:NusB antitermination factor [Candidatus Omnitrophus magneticus]
MRNRTLSREIALKILYSWEISAETITLCAKKYWDNNKLEEETVVAFCEYLLKGVDKYKIELDEKIAKAALNWTISRMSCIDRNILRIASFELLFTIDIPDKVTINEAINLAKKYGDKDSGRFVNGVLDKVKTYGKISGVFQSE